ncbi:MAG: hypothetical protein M9916_11115 [Crocinitomicaceae bacterium]|nr:hypothetical protein [Crocinitomicaceae bacterium]
MHIIKYIGAVILGVSILYSCKNNQPEPELKKETVDNSSEFEGVEELFNSKEFDDPSAVELLKEINICSDTQMDADGNLVSPCTAEHFKFFPLKNGTPLKDGFILLVKANTGGIPLRRVLVFERENDALIKVNGFIANIIGFRKNPSSNDDLLLRFIDKIEGSDVYYNCILKWENQKYVFKTVEVIEEPAGNFRGLVKESVKDSVSQEIYKTLVDNNMIF